MAANSGAGRDSVEQAWRIVDPILAMPMPVFAYKAGSWRPQEAGKMTEAIGGWHQPAAAN